MIRIILILAAWRLVSMIVSEDGPMDVFVRFRVFLGVRYDQNNVPYPTNSVSRGIMCSWCTSVWIGFIVSIFDMFLIGDFNTSNAVMTIGTWFALSLFYSACISIIDTVISGIATALDRMML